MLSLILGALVAIPQFDRGAPLPRKAYLGLQTSETNGSLTASRIVPASPAERMGLKPGDVVLAINGKTVKTSAETVATVSQLRTGDRVDVLIRRDGKTVKIAETVDARPMVVEPDLDVIYDQVVANGKRVRVIITKPKSEGKFPTLFMIGGIGGYSLDGPYAGIPYGNILGPIARAGYVVVRIDKPGQGDSEGPAYAKLRFHEERVAYVQALRLAKSLPYVNSDRIAIFGHSMGGVFGPLVAAEEPVRGLAVMGTLFKPFNEYVLENARRQSELGDADPAGLDEEQRRLFAASQYLFGDGDTPTEMARKHPEMADYARGLADETFSGVGLRFWYELSHVNVPDAWAKVKAQVLIMCAENDFLSGRDDHERIARFVNQKRPGTAEFKLMTGVDHYFIQTTSMRDSMAKGGRGAMNPIVVNTLLEFLKNTLR